MLEGFVEECAAAALTSAKLTAAGFGGPKLQRAAAFQGGFATELRRDVGMQGRSALIQPEG
jgi:hypothetical protein